MSARDELAAVIRSTEEYGPDHDFILPTKAADAILAAGYSKPRTISTVKELDAMPFGSIVFDANGDAELKVNTDQSWLELRDHGVLEDSVNLPATVLYTPKES